MLTIRRILQRKKLRKTNHDYAGSFSYFVTICIKDRIECFGEIIDKKMILNEYGNIANEQFEWFKNQYQYIKIPTWVIMPNHIHAIIEIDDTRGRSRPTPDMVIHSRPTRYMESPKIKPLPELIGAYKTTTSKKIHLSGLTGFRWHRSYHERIINNKIQYARISEYIKKNPEMSDRDRTQEVT